jgi:copper(I)-binding protein
MRVLVMALLLAGHPPGAPAQRSASPDLLVVRDAWVRETSAMRTVSSGYLTIENRSDTPVGLVGIVVDGVRNAALHSVVDQQGRTAMRPIATLPVPARGSARLTPGGTHVMLTDVLRPLQAGTTVRMTLTFDNHQTRTVQARVRPLDAESAR